MKVSFSFLIILFFSLVESLNSKMEPCQYVKHFEEEQMVEISMSEDAKLWAPPGSKHEIRFNVYLSDTLDLVHVYFSYREEFGGTDPDSRVHRHAELVRKMEPKLVRNAAPNVTLETTLMLDIPDYVTLASQTKITVTVRCQTVNQTIVNIPATAEMSFYFTVSDLPLESLDPIKPECEKRRLCKDHNEAACAKSKKSEKCSEHFWHSELLVKDNLTGIRDIEVTSPGSRLVKTSSHLSRVVGSSRTFVTLVRTECCYDGVELTVRDVAGNSVKCVAGINPNAAGKTGSNDLMLIIILLHFFGVLFR